LLPKSSKSCSIRPRMSSNQYEEWTHTYAIDKYPHHYDFSTRKQRTVSELIFFKGEFILDIYDARKEFYIFTEIKLSSACFSWPSINRFISTILSSCFQKKGEKFFFIFGDWKTNFCQKIFTISKRFSLFFEFPLTKPAWGEKFFFSSSF